jgi:ferredoxin
MLPAPGIVTKQGDSGLRPRIDYGRCCWCALCVDVCMTKSLTMSNEYKWVESDPDKFRFTPGVDKKHWDDAPSWATAARTPPPHRPGPPPHGRDGARRAHRRSFAEIVEGYTVDQAKLEADRCVSCGLCIATCPTHMAIPDYIKPPCATATTSAALSCSTTPTPSPASAAGSAPTSARPPAPRATRGTHRHPLAQAPHHGSGQSSSSAWRRWASPPRPPARRSPSSAPDRPASPPPSTWPSRAIRSPSSRPWTSPAA